MDEKVLGFYIFRGCSYICVVFAIVSLVTLNVVGGIGWAVCAGILKIIAKHLQKKIEE